MTTSGFDPEFIPADVRVDDEMIHVRFESGLEIATPVARFPRLQRATPDQRRTWRLIGRGDGIHWPDVDEDISVRGLFSKERRPPLSSIEQVPALISDLYKITSKLESMFDGQPFTPDGILVGSIGKVVAQYIYDLKLEAFNAPNWNATTKDHRSVQVKLSGESGRYAVRQRATEQELPDLLISLRLTNNGFEEIYNGAFPVDLLRGRKPNSNGQVSLSAKELSAENPSLLVPVNSLNSLNRWFTPHLADVA